MKLKSIILAGTGLGAFAMPMAAQEAKQETVGTPAADERVMDTIIVEGTQLSRLRGIE